MCTVYRSGDVVRDPNAGIFEDLALAVCLSRVCCVTKTLATKPQATKP